MSPRISPVTSDLRGASAGTVDFGAASLLEEEEAPEIEDEPPTPGPAEMVDALRDEIGKPQLRVSDLITPPSLAAAPPPLIDAAKVPAKSEPKKPGFNTKALLIFLALLAWCGLCLVPILKRSKSRDQTASE